MARITVYHVPICPFSQRLEILLTLKQKLESVDFKVIDVTQPRPKWLLKKTGGSTTLPVLETREGRVIKESMVLLRYLEDIIPNPPIAQKDPYRRAVENMLVTLEAAFTDQGYRFVMNQDRSRQAVFREGMWQQYAKLDQFLSEHSPTSTWLVDQFGWAEVVFTPLFQRFWFLEYYENFELPDGPQYDRVRQWRDACVEHPAAQQVTKEQIIKLYFDYAKGAANGALVPGRRRSSFALEPHWSDRPWPPRNKYAQSPSDGTLGLQ